MKLSTRYGRMTAAEREALADKAGVSPGYLRQIATGWVRPDRGRAVRPSLNLIRRLAQADSRLTVSDLVSEFAD